MVTVDDVRSFVAQLPRSYEVLVRDRVKFRVGQIVYVAFSRDETLMGFAFPKEEREALVDSEPEKFMMPTGGDLRFKWVIVRLAAIDVEEMRELVFDAWRMVVPKKLAAAYDERFFAGELYHLAGPVAVAHPLRPDPLLAGREDAVGIQRILDRLGEATVGVVVERVLVGGEVHEVQVRAVLAVALLGRLRHEPPGHVVGGAGLRLVLRVEDDHRDVDEAARVNGMIPAM